jgi:4-oxalocrotonate tautomerase family enzyme
MAEGRPPERKTLLIKAVTEAVTATLGVEAKDVDVVLVEVPADNFGVAGIPLSEIRRTSKH